MGTPSGGVKCTRWGLPGVRNRCFRCTFGIASMNGFTIPGVPRDRATTAVR